MDWKLFIGTFMTIFIAEMGDKTQFAALAASADSKGAIEVLGAVILALALAGTIGFYAGQVMSHHLRPDMIKYLSGGLFIAMGIWILLRP
jgi:putative Ca2+/H+ antiporter (TMEM165/GDT1 family)